MGKPPPRSRPTEATAASLSLIQAPEHENAMTAMSNLSISAKIDDVAADRVLWVREGRQRLREELEQSSAEHKNTSSLANQKNKDIDTKAAEAASILETPAEKGESVAVIIESSDARSRPRIASKPIAICLGTALGAKQNRLFGPSPPRDNSNKMINRHDSHGIRSFGTVKAGSGTSARVPAAETIALAASEQTRTAENATACSENRSRVGEAKRPTNGASQQGGTDGTSMSVVGLTVKNLNTHQSEFGATTRNARPPSESAEKDSESEAASIRMNVLAGSQLINPSIKTRTVQVRTADLTFATIPCDTDTTLKDFHIVQREHFSIGDIGYFPILRPSACPSFMDIQIQFGYVSGKAYPAVIIDTPEDSIFVLLITTAGGKGLKCKPESLQQRSARVVSERASVYLRETLPQVGKWLLPNKLLRVTKKSIYQPEAECFIDVGTRTSCRTNPGFKRLAPPPRGVLVIWS